MPSNRKRLYVSLVLNLATVIMEVIGLSETIADNGIGLFQFYTEDSNILALIACSLCAVFTLRCLIKSEASIPVWVKSIKYAATCCLTVTLVVVVCVLSPPMGLEGYKMMMLSGSMLYHHFLCPVTALIGFIFFEREPVLDGKHTLYALIPTLLYAAVSIILNVARVMVGPYPFLLVYEQPVYMSVVWFFVICGGAYLAARLIWRANGNKRRALKLKR